MPYEHIKMPSGLHVKFSGIVSKDTILDSQSVILGSSNFESYKYIISDYSYIRDLDLSGFNISEISINAFSLSKWKPKLKVALVVPNKFIGFGEQYVRMARKAGLKWDVKIFTESAEAKDWIKNQFD